jgi:hypothetical protein
VLEQQDARELGALGAGFERRACRAQGALAPAAPHSGGTRWRPQLLHARSGRPRWNAKPAHRDTATSRPNKVKSQPDDSALARHAGGTLDPESSERHCATARASTAAGRSMIRERQPAVVAGLRLVGLHQVEVSAEARDSSSVASW